MLYIPATNMDPTLQMVHTCGYLAGLDIDVHLKVSLLGAKILQCIHDHMTDSALVRC